MVLAGSKGWKQHLQRSISSPMEVISGWRTFVFLSTLYCSCNILSQGGDTLEQGLSIRDQIEARNPAQSLVSANGIFELGFFSPANSQNRYVGIWYKKVKERTVVWIANRNEPLKDDTGSLMIAPNGNLMIRNARGMTIILSTVISQSHVRLKLLDSGNLVLIEGNEGDGENRILWQSFDYPSDTCLPDMKLGVGKMGEGLSMLTSWRGKDDPSPGAFTLGLDSGSASQLYVLKERRNIQWMSGFWNGQVFSWIPETRVYNFRFESNEHGSYFSYSASDASAVSRLMMDVSGEVKLFSWSEKTEDWSLLWSQPRGVCDFSERCGPNTVCDSYASPPCKCLPGFEPLSQEDWRSNVWSAGCKRQTPLTCEVGDSFKQMKMTRLPAPSYNLRESNVLLEDCNAMCRGRCSCMAYASANEDGTGCYLWNDNVLIGLQANNSSGRNIYVRLSVLEPGGKTKRRLWIMAPVIVPSVLVVASICYLRRRAIVKRRRGPRHKGKRETSEEEPFFNLAPTPLGKNGLEFQVFDLATISAATDNFSLANKLGEGGFGPVYKNRDKSFTLTNFGNRQGKLHKGKQIAVKRLSRRSSQGLEEFRNEVILIAKLQHINLVRLLGCCIEEEEKILVYEYMPNKSLDSFLFVPAKRKLLDRRTCIRIINGIAQGLLYLHKYSRLRIIHRDLKASNVLLDSEMNPKISDFGMARIFGQDESEANTKRIVGTYGYMSPEYAMGGLFSEKSDVFSFGVLLLEIVTGKKNSSFNGFEKCLNLLGYAWELWKEGRSLDLIDPALRDSSPEWEITRCIHLGLLCVQESARDRPTMSSVAALLSNENIPLAAPTRPAFTFGRDLTMTSKGTYSANQLTISVMEAR